MLEPSTGGLATGLRGPHASSGGLWIGWPGDVARLDAAQRQELDARLAASRLLPIHLSPSEIDRYYEGFANGVLWPLFHYMPDRMPLDARDWSTYVQVNTRFAAEVAAAWRPGDLVWIHDYHLLLVPKLLRERLPEARIGLFLHIPFPSSEVFRMLPWRAEVLDGMLGADVIGFHTYIDVQHFLTAALRVLGLEPEVDRLFRAGRMVRVGAFPMGIDVETFDAARPSPAITADLATLREDSTRSLLVGVDRLDYTKGIPRRLLAVERVLERSPRWRGRLRLLQVSVPSREGVRHYRELRRQVDELVGRVNGEWATIRWAPIQILHRAFSETELAALYRQADVMLVTPLRDGMNLVAKEYVAARTDEDGVLVLSEFAGAAAEMGEALIVNPHDVDAMADAIERALVMPREERRRRMSALRLRVRSHDVHAWADSFVSALDQVPHPPAPTALLAVAGPALLTRLAAPDTLLLLLDHDGTLVPLAPFPEAAAPDPGLLALLRGLAALPGTVVHIVSGRDFPTLERWYGGLPVGLHAEHGAWSRLHGSEEWVSAGLSLGAWEAPIREVMDTFVARTPGAFVEEKTCTLAWHYRLTDVGFGASVARELRHHLRALLASAPVEVVAGNRVIEVRPVGINKGRVATMALADPVLGEGFACLACGDDRTDEDMFAALPPDAVSLAVGDRVSRAGCRVPDVAGLRRFLADLLGTRSARPGRTSPGRAEGAGADRAV